MKSGLKSKDQINVTINRNFIIRVLENPKQNQSKNTKLTSAKQLSTYIQDEELKLRMFEKVLKGKANNTIFFIRNRLKIVFRTK